MIGNYLTTTNIRQNFAYAVYTLFGPSHFLDVFASPNVSFLLLKNELPPDAQFKGYEAFIVQGV